MDRFGPTGVDIQTSGDARVFVGAGFRSAVQQIKTMAAHLGTFTP